MDCIYEPKYLNIIVSLGLIRKMRNSANLIDDLCDKLKPYVKSVITETFPREEPTKYKIDTKELYDLLAEEAADEKIMELLIAGFYVASNPLDPSVSTELRTQVYTQEIAATWSETLRWAYKEQGKIGLRDCLLPDKLGRAERAWTFTINRMGFSQEQVEDLLKQFGREEITDKLDLSWGGYVKRVGNSYELRMRNKRKF